jgi:hypothetical protein
LHSQFSISFPIAQWQKPIQHIDAIALIGSCFTENITSKLAQSGFRTLQNPHGILFNPASVLKCIEDIATQKVYTESDLFYLHEAYHSWYHHSRFSGITAAEALHKINTSIAEAKQFISAANIVVLTLGSAFAYRHLEKNILVSNNHRAPSQEFEKTLLPIDQIQSMLEQCIRLLHTIHPAIRVVFTISPVRHLRDGVIDNNRSKARLLEAVHSITEQHKDQTIYFPSYEIVMDELRDYRFYDIDFAHPNYTATQYVWERFKAIAIDHSCHALMEKLQQIHIAKNHRSSNPSSIAHQDFLQKHLALCKALQEEFPYLDLSEEIGYFSLQL